MLHLPYRELPVDDPGTPDTGSPLRYLVWLARHQRWLLTLNAFFGIGWMVAQALVWAAVGAAIDHGVERHDTGELLQVGRRSSSCSASSRPCCGSLRHQLAVTNWMNATYRTIQVIGRHISREPAPPSPTRSPRATSSTPSPADAMRIGGTYDGFARFSGAIVAWIVVSFILLSTSVELGLIVLLGVPDPRVTHRRP